MLSTYIDLLNGATKASVVGMGKRGMAMAVALARRINVVGFDRDKAKFDTLTDIMEQSHDVGGNGIKHGKVEFTAEAKRLREAQFHVVTATMSGQNGQTVDVKSVKETCEVLGRNLSWGSIVVFEDSLGADIVNEVCIKALEMESGLACGVGFKIGVWPKGDSGVLSAEEESCGIRGTDPATQDQVDKVAALSRQ